MIPHLSGSNVWTYVVNLLSAFCDKGHHHSDSEALKRTDNPHPSGKAVAKLKEKREVSLSINLLQTIMHGRMQWTTDLIKSIALRATAVEHVLLSAHPYMESQAASPRASQYAIGCVEPDLQ